MQTIWFIFHNDHLLFHQDITQPEESLRLLEQPLAHIENVLKIGTFEGHECYCARLPSEQVLPETLKSLSLRAALNTLGEPWFNVLVRAHAILNWNINHQFCGRCSTLTEHRSASFERICPKCQLNFYPRISPSIIVRIRKGDHILLARGLGFPPGAYGLIAGFVEPGESLEETIHREVMEEVGIRISNIQYVTSQPWPFPDSLMVGYTADYLSGDIVVDHTELETAGWFRYNALPGSPSSRLSLSSKLIEAFVEEVEKEQAHDQ